MKELLSRIWMTIKKIRWGWGFLYAVYTVVVYLRLIKIFGSTLFGVIAAYFLLCFVASVMRKS